jgi:hypothetical protein
VLEIQFPAWNTNKNVVELNQLKGSHLVILPMVTNLCIALVVGCFVDISGVVFVFNGVEVIVGCFVDIGGVAYHHNYNFFS